MGEISNRLQISSARISEIQSRLLEAENLLGSNACVYVTGSFGRLEASSYSDLDLFILGKFLKDEEGKAGRNSLNRLDEICVKAHLINATRQLGFPEFSKEGRYLAHYSVEELTKTLGKAEDDATNTFTARLLLLLESRPLLGSEVYNELLTEVIEPYWRDYDDHESEFIPAFLANDILRLWRTLCVNYEAYTERSPEDKKAEAKLKNYKLKHSRMLTCYSALLFMLNKFNIHNTVTREDVLEMSAMAPLNRLNYLIDCKHSVNAKSKIQELVDKYEKFLETTNKPEDELIDIFKNRSSCKDLISASYLFGDVMFNAISLLGSNSRFHRLLLV